MPVTLALHNRTSVRLDLFAIDPAGNVTGQGTLPKGTSTTTQTDSGVIWRAVEPFSRKTFAEHLVDEREDQEVILERRSKETRHPGTITFQNASLLTVAVNWLDPDGREKQYAVLKPGESNTQPTFETHAWTIRDEETTLPLETVVASRGDQTVRIDDANLRSVPSDQVVTAVFKNTTPIEVNLFWVNGEGQEELQGSIPAGGHLRQLTRPGHPWRARSLATGEPVAVIIADETELQFREIRLPSFEKNPATTIEFRNETPLDVDLMWVSPSGEEVRFKGLSPMESVEHATFATHQWVLRDAHSGIPLGSTTATAEPSEFSVTAASVTPQPGTAPVVVDFHNRTSFTIEALASGENGETARFVLTPGAMESRSTFAGRAWSIREQVTGNVIGLFIPNSEERQNCEVHLRSAHSRQPAGIAFVNQTRFIAEVCWMDYNGVAQPRATLLPGAAARFATFQTHPWIVRDARSGQVVALTFARAGNDRVDITNESLRFVPVTDPVSFFVVNNLPFPVRVMRVTESGDEEFVSRLAHAITLQVPTSPGQLWRFRSAQSGHEVALYAAGRAPTQECELTLRAAAPDIPGDIHFFNATPLEVELLAVNEQGEEVSRGTLGSRDTKKEQSFAGQPWIVRDVVSRRAVAVTVGLPDRQHLRIASQPLRSVGAPSSVKVTFQSTTLAPVDMRLVDDEGRVQPPFATIEAGNEFTFSTAPGTVWRFVRQGTESEIDLYIPGAEPVQTHAIRNSLVRVGQRPGGELFDGEVALFEQPNFEGESWIVQADLPNFADIEGLNERVSSIRMGPDTAVTAFRDADFQGTNDVFVMSAPSFAETDVGDDQISSIQIVTSVPPEQVLLSHTITLGEDFRSSADGGIEKFSAHRAILTFPPEVREVDVWGTEEVTISVAGEKHTIDAVRPVRLEPNLASKLMITIDATTLATAGLQLRTNTMPENERFFIFPDRDASRRVANMEPNKLFANRERLGIREGFTEQHCAQVQSAIQSLYKTVQASVPAAGGERSVAVDEMEHSTWALELGAGSPDDVLYRPIAQAELDVMRAGATLIGESLGQDILDSALKTIGVPGGTKTVSVAFNNAGSQLEAGVKDAGKTVLTKLGDAAKPVGEFFNENLAEPVTKAFREAEAAVSGIVNKALEVIVRVGEQAARFVLNTAQKVAGFVEDVIGQIGATVAKFVDMLKLLFDWDSILDTHDALMDLCNRGLERAGAGIAALRPMLAQVFDALAASTDEGIDRLISELDPDATATASKSAAGSVAGTDGEDRTDWFLSKLSENLPQVSGVAIEEPNNELANLFSDFLEQLEMVAQNLLPVVSEAVEAAMDAFGRAAADPKNALKLTLAGVLHGLKAVFAVALQAGRAILDLALRVMEALVGLLKRALDAPLNIPVISDLYRAINPGEELTLLSVACLALAIPATVMARATIGFAPGPALGRVAAAVNPETAATLAKAATYSACQFLLAIFAPTAAVLDVLTKRIGQEFAFIVKFFIQVWFSIGLMMQYPFQFGSGFTGNSADLGHWATRPEKEASGAWIAGAFLTILGWISWTVSAGFAFAAARASEPALKTARETRAKAADALLGFVSFATAVIILRYTVDFVDFTSVRINNTLDLTSRHVPPRTIDEIPNEELASIRLPAGTDPGEDSGRSQKRDRLKQWKKQEDAPFNRFAGGNIVGCIPPIVDGLAAFRSLLPEAKSALALKIGGAAAALGAISYTTVGSIVVDSIRKNDLV